MSADPSRLLELIDGLSPELKLRAFTHTSWTDDRAKTYERLAYLGDGVLGMVVADLLIDEYPEATAGELTKIRARAVSRAACFRVGAQLGLKERLEANAPEQAEIPVADVVGASSVIAEVCEAVIGAVFQQYGYREAVAAVARAFADEIADAAEHPNDAKSDLQEFLARRGQKPDYVVIGSGGPAHDRRFECAVEIRGDRYGTGIGRSKKEAEQAAAQEALTALRKPPASATGN